jgi:hypothetical protein
MNIAKNALVAFVISLSASIGAQDRQIESSAGTDQRAAVSPFEQALERAPIKSLSAWQQHLSKGVDKSQALGQLHGDALAGFSASLSFNEKGLTGFSYAELRELTASEAHNLLSLFGFQHTARLVTDVRIETPLDVAVVNGAFSLSNLPIGMKGRQKTIEDDLQALWDSLFWDDLFGSSAGTDYKDYYCHSRASCAEHKGTICLSTC